MDLQHESLGTDHRFRVVLWGTIAAWGFLILVLLWNMDVSSKQTPKVSLQAMGNGTLVSVLALNPVV